jgi:hypothetical protein
VVRSAVVTCASAQIQQQPSSLGRLVQVVATPPAGRKIRSPRPPMQGRRHTQPQAQRRKPAQHSTQAKIPARARDMHRRRSRLLSGLFGAKGIETQSTHS